MRYGQRGMKRIATTNIVVTRSPSSRAELKKATMLRGERVEKLRGGAREVRISGRDFRFARKRGTRIENRIESDGGR
jgi:hypothetical protein